MPEAIIADTSCLIIFDKIAGFELLHAVYNKIYITPFIAEEYGKSLPTWIETKRTKDTKIQKFLKSFVDEGEASVIALALEQNDALLLLDDLKARKLAGRLNLKFSGTLGIISKAKEIGFISHVRPWIDKLLQTDFRISRGIIDKLLSKNGE